ncbi:hypothetical protein CG431_14315 [Pantoea ananatis]|nr:hypothetical protein CG431_14315 [Pantoea ananatis]
MRFPIGCFMNKKRKLKREGSSDIQRNDAAAPCVNDYGNKKSSSEKGALCLLAFFSPSISRSTLYST